MRTVDFKRLTGLEEGFDFGNQAHRTCVLATAYDDSRNFTFGHYKIGDSGGTITVGGVAHGDRLYYAVSICSPLDNFSKRVGRKNVEDNFVQDKNSMKRGVVSIADIRGENPAIVLKRAAQSYLRKNKMLPKWSRKEVDFRK